MDSWGSLDILAGFGICRLVEAVMKIPADPCSNRGESAIIIIRLIINDEADKIRT